MVKQLVPGQFGLAACQASVFTPDGELALIHVVRELLPAWQERFDAPPQLESHPESPTPRLVLRSATGMWRCEIAADRADLYWIRPAPHAPAPAVIDFFTIAGGLLGQYATATGSRVGRCAALVHRVAGHSAPTLTLVQQLVHPALAAIAFDDVDELDLGTRRRFALGGRFLVNALVRCRSGDGMVLLDQDLNTLAERAAAERFAAADLAAFFELAAREHDAALPRLFPAEPR